MNKLDNMTLKQVREAVENCGVYFGLDLGDKIKGKIIEKIIKHGHLFFIDDILEKLTPKDKGKFIIFHFELNRLLKCSHEVHNSKRYIDKIKSEGKGGLIAFKPKKKPDIFFNPFLDWLL